MFELSVRGDIAAAHFLRDYEGPCKNLHGHTWKVEVTVVSETLDRTGMVIDFRAIKAKLKEFLAPLDHVCLNDLACFKEHNPTAENIARYVYRSFATVVAPLKIRHVQVWESETSNVLYYE